MRKGKVDEWAGVEMLKGDLPKMQGPPHVMTDCIFKESQLMRFF